MPLNQILNTRELPWDKLRAFAMPAEEAAKLATEYECSWFYPLAGSDNGYFYVLQSEYEQKQQEKHHATVNN